MSDISEHPNADVIRRFRALADWLESHPEIPTQHEGAFAIYCFTREQLADVARAMPGVKRKDYDDNFARVHGEVGGFSVYAFTDRNQVCRKIEKQVTRPAEPEQVIPAKPERVETVVEWECGDSILRGETDAESTGSKTEAVAA